MKKETIKGGGMNAGKFVDQIEKYLRMIIVANNDAADPDRKYEIKMGRRFAKIVEWFYRNEQVFCFVEIATGDIHKSGTWYQPQKNGKRGNIYSGPLPVKCGDFYLKSDKNSVSFRNQTDRMRLNSESCSTHGHIPDGNGFCFRCGDQLGIEVSIK